MCSKEIINVYISIGSSWTWYGNPIQGFGLVTTSTGRHTNYGEWVNSVWSWLLTLCREPMVALWGVSKVGVELPLNFVSRAHVSTNNQTQGFVLVTMRTWRHRTWGFHSGCCLHSNREKWVGSVWSCLSISSPEPMVALVIFNGICQIDSQWRSLDITRYYSVSF